MTKLERVRSARSGKTMGECSVIEDFDPYGSTYVFWEEIKQLGLAAPEIQGEDFDEKLLKEALRSAEPI